jgi:hypothetical protein
MRRLPTDAVGPVSGDERLPTTRSGPQAVEGQLAFGAATPRHKRCG